MIKAVVFDAGGVIDDWQNPLRNFLKELKVDFESAQELNKDLIVASELGDISNREFVQKYMIKVGRPDKWQELERFMPEGFVLYDEVLELIKELKPRFKLALLSNAQIGSIDKLDKKWQLRQHFELIVDSSVERVRKPDPRIFQIVLTRLDLPAEACLFIDDMLVNIQAAEKLGFKTFQFINPKESVKLIRKTLDETV